MASYAIDRGAGKCLAVGTTREAMLAAQKAELAAAGPCHIVVVDDSRGLVWTGNGTLANAGKAKERRDLRKQEERARMTAEVAAADAERVRTRAAKRAELAGAELEAATATAEKAAAAVAAVPKKKRGRPPKKKAAE